MAKKAPAQAVLMYQLPNGISYIDLAEGLSRVNRRLYRQGMQYAVSKIDFFFASNPDAVQSLGVDIAVAGDTWVVHNAWKKAQAVWLGQQRNTRAMIGQSAKPTWEDFKVYLDDGNRAGTINAVQAGDSAVGAAVAVGAGEWDYSKMVHVDDADASHDEWYLHLVGGNVADTDKGLILAYQNSRATVQPADPSLPTEYQSNMYALLAADENVAADEIAQNMEDENDEPPYDHDDYPGNDTNSDWPWHVSAAYASSASPHGICSPFVAQCGLLKCTVGALDPSGAATAAPTTAVLIHLTPGGYQGVAAIPMGQ
jgi:hypothetical protein